jgi:hypothetical protein
VPRAKQRAQIPADQPVQLVIYPPKKSLYELVANPFDLLPIGARRGDPSGAWLPAWLPGPNRRALIQASLPWRLFRPGEPLALMPYVVVR